MQEAPHESLGIYREPDEPTAVGRFFGGIKSYQDRSRAHDRARVGQLKLLHRARSLNSGIDGEHPSIGPWACWAATMASLQIRRSTRLSPRL